MNLMDLRGLNFRKCGPEFPFRFQFLEIINCTTGIALAIISTIVATLLLR